MASTIKQEASKRVDDSGRKVEELNPEVAKIFPLKISVEVS